MSSLLKDDYDRQQATGNRQQATGNRQQIVDRSKDYVNIRYAGNMRNQNQGFVGSVYFINGISPALRARDYKEPVLILKKLFV